MVRTKTTMSTGQGFPGAAKVASSAKPGRGPEYALDNSTATWWEPAEDDANPVLTMSLSPAVDRDRVQTSPVDKVSEIICKVADLEDQIEQLQEEKALLIIEIGDAIEQLEDDNEKTVLAEFYIGRVPMAQVAEIINYSVRRTYYFRKQGVLHLGEILGGIS